MTEGAKKEDSSYSSSVYLAPFQLKSMFSNIKNTV